MNKIVKAVFAGSMVTPLTVVIAFIFDYFFFPSSNSEYTLSSAISIGLVAGLYGIVYTAFILILYAVPIFLYLQLLNMANRVSCVFFVLLPALILFILAVLASPDMQGIKNGFNAALPIAWFSIISGGVFWKYAKEYNY